MHSRSAEIYVFEGVLHILIDLTNQYAMICFFGDSSNDIVTFLCYRETNNRVSLKSVSNCNTSKTPIRSRNNSKIYGSRQDYLVGKSGRPRIYLVVIWPRFKQIT